MKRLVFAVLASVCAFACAEAAIYLKSDAQGTADGTSWSNAYTDWNTALNALNAIPDGGDRTLLIAKGTYKPAEDGGSTTVKNLVTGTGFVIRGGYRAQSDDDTERDADLYPTIFTPMADVSALKWKHIEVNPETGAITETVTENPMFVGGVLQPHPAYTGDYDTYCADSWGGKDAGVKPLTVGANASGTIDGIFFVKNGYFRQDQYFGVVQYQSKAAENWLSNCTFVATTARRGAITDSAGTSTKTSRHISNCRFISCLDFNKSGACVHGGGNTIVEDCVFEGNYCPTDYESSLIYTGGMDNDVRRCTFTRNVRVMSSTAQPAVVGAGSPSWQECTFTRNVGVGLDGVCAPLLVSSARQGQSGNRNQTGEMRNCLIAENLVFCALKGDGNCYNLIGVNGRTRENANNNINLDSSPAYVNCMFKANRLVAPANELAAGAVAYMGILGNAYVDATLMNVWMSVIGCSFVSNSVEYAAGVEGSSVAVSRGIAFNSLASLSCQAGVANCTFLGPNDGTPDFRQNGVHNNVSTLLNCIFTTEDPNAVLSPFVSDSPGSLSVIDCAVENMYPELQPSNLRTLRGLVYDHIPVKEVVAGTLGNRTLVPLVKVPSIRTSEGADIATNLTRDDGNNYAASFAYRTYENGKWGSWQALVSNLGTGVTKAGGAMSDALGTVRTQKAMTRGAVQALDETAETGANLVLRRSPVVGGTLSSPANQAVASGTAITPVTATTENSFAGWYDANDNLYSADNPLVLDSLTSNLVLTAKFETQKTTLTFILGEHGIFAETGTGTCVVEAPAHTPFPAVPAYTVEEGWHLVSWPEFPAVVPEGDVVYTAKIVSKEKCVRYVAPTARGTGDGTSPENATADFAAAYEEASAYVGEVRVEGGTYVLAAPVRIRANVAVLGEEGAFVVFTGDTLGDDIWTDNNATEVGAVWTAGAFNEPNPDGADDYWVARSPNADDNTLYGFLNSAGETATNAVFRNVTFTGFARSAVRSEQGLVDGLVLDSCRFLANGTARDATYATVSLPIAASVTITNCAFTGNGPVYSTTFAEAGNTNVISGCSFTANTGTVLDFTMNVHSNLFDVSGCTFARNYAPGTAILRLTGNAHLPGCRFADCTVTETRTGQQCVYISSSAKNDIGSEELKEPSLTVERCSFTGTRGSGVSSGGCGIILRMGGRYFWCDWVNCRFADNVCTNDYGTVAALVYNSSYHWEAFIGCTFENNEIVSTHANGTSTILATDGRLQDLFGSVFAHNRLVAPTTGNVGVLGNFEGTSTAPNWNSLVALSCVFDEDGIPPFCSSKDFASARFRNCAVANTNAIVCLTKPDYVDCYIGSAGVNAASTVGPNGVRSLGLKGSTACRLTGMPLWKRPSTGVYYWYDKTTTDPRYFYKNLSGFAPSQSKTGAAAEGYGIGYPAVPDAFGASRKVKVLQDAQYGDDPRTAPGPLNPDSMGLIILVL